MVQQTRRQFFKTILATAAGVVAVGVAPAAEVEGKEPEIGVGNRAKHLIYGEPGTGKTYMTFKDLPKPLVWTWYDAPVETNW